MNEWLKWRLFGLGLCGFCGAEWAWMLGAFATLPATGLGSQSAQWIAPGVLAMPATIATFAGGLGALFLLGVFPVRTQVEVPEK